jgi:hypothetical protein
MFCGVQQEIVGIHRALLAECTGRSKARMPRVTDSGLFGKALGEVVQLVGRFHIPQPRSSNPAKTEWILPQLQAY